MTRSLLRALPAVALLWAASPVQAQDAASVAASNKLDDGGFEADTPSYFRAEGAGATWSTAEAHSGTHSLALSGAGAASWVQDEVVLNWVSAFPANTALTLGAWVNLQGVNTAPASDDAKFQIVYTFRDGAGADILGQPVVLDLPQGAASTGGWVRATTAALGEIILPVEATSVTAEVRKGASATGTAYVDDFFALNGDGNPATSWHGANVDLPGGWYTFWPGFDAGLADPEWVLAKTTDEAHSGGASLRVERLGSPSDAEGEAVAITERVPVTVGKPVLVSYWLKTEGNGAPSEIGTGDNNVGLTALWYSSLESGAAGYNELGGADIRLNGEYNTQVIPLLPRQADNGWTQYSFVVNPIANAVGMELRLRYWHQFTGTTYWDDVVIADVDDVTMELPNLLSESAEGFEGDRPSYWAPSGAGATWSTDRAHSGTYSLALSGAGAASWTQAEVIQNWESGFEANTALTLGAWVYTEGVNTAPASDDAKFQIVYTFRDAAGADILGQPVVLDLPQADATTGGWVQVTTAGLGEITLPVDAKSVTAVVRKGAGATGTVYVDDFSVNANTWHGANVDLPADWYTFWPGFDGGPADPQWTVSKTTDEAHTGNASVRVERLGSPTDVEGEAVVISERVPAMPGRADAGELLAQDRGERRAGRDRDRRQQRRDHGPVVLVAGERRGRVQRARRGRHPAERGVQHAGHPAPAAPGRQRLDELRLRALPDRERGRHGGPPAVLAPVHGRDLLGRRLDHQHRRGQPVRHGRRARPRGGRTRRSGDLAAPERAQPVLGADRGPVHAAPGAGRDARGLRRHGPPRGPARRRRADDGRRPRRHVRVGRRRQRDLPGRAADADAHGGPPDHRRPLGEGGRARARPPTPSTSGPPSWRPSGAAPVSLAS